MTHRGSQAQEIPPHPFSSPGGYLQASAEEWSDCGTTACVAGHMAAVIVRDHPELIEWPRNPSSRVEATAEEAVVRTLRAIGMPAVGQDHLWVFSPFRSRSQILEWVDAVAAGEDPTEASRRMSSEAEAGD